MTDYPLTPATIQAEAGRWEGCTHRSRSLLANSREVGRRCRRTSPVSSGITIRRIEQPDVRGRHRAARRVASWIVRQRVTNGTGRGCANLIRTIVAPRTDATDDYRLVLRQGVCTGRERCRAGRPSCGADRVGALVCRVNRRVGVAQLRRNGVGVAARTVRCRTTRYVRANSGPGRGTPRCLPEGRLS